MLKVIMVQKSESTYTLYNTFKTGTTFMLVTSHIRYPVYIVCDIQYKFRRISLIRSSFNLLKMLSSAPNQPYKLSIQKNSLRG